MFSGDEVTFSADERSETIVVQLEGSYYGPSRFALPRDARLSELLDAVAVPEGMTAVESVSLRRESVAAQQAEALQESLRRLGIDTIGKLARAPVESLKKLLGSHGEHLHSMALGLDDSPVVGRGEARSMSRETTFAEDLRDRAVLEATLR